MKKHFLITISNDIDSISGVHFVCSFFKKISQHSVTILHIYRLDNNDTENSLTEMWAHPDDKVWGQLTVGARRSIDKATSLLGPSNMSIDQMMTKTVAERYGKVKDILIEGSRGLYDAVILGRRASYALQWIFEKPGDETAQAMIKDSCFTSPLWICPQPDPGKKNVLLCIDGSANSYRAVDHVGYILSVQDQHKITLFNVDSGAGTDGDEIFQRATAILHTHNIGNERINKNCSWGLSVAGTILSEIDKGGYGAVALGLRGHKHGLLKNYNLAGGTTSKLIGKLDTTSLWCCP